MNNKEGRKGYLSSDNLDIIITFNYTSYIFNLLLFKCA